LLAGGISALARLPWIGGLIVTAAGIVMSGPWVFRGMPLPLVVLYPLIGTAAGTFGLAALQRPRRMARPRHAMEAEEHGSPASLLVPVQVDERQRAARQADQPALLVGDADLPHAAGASDVGRRGHRPHRALALGPDVVGVDLHP